MKGFFSIFTASAREFKNIHSIITAALLVALHTVLAVFLSIQVTTSLRISISFITNVATGFLFGPVMGFVCGGIGDIVQFLIKPVGPYFPGWTLNAAMAGLIYGMFFYRIRNFEEIPYSIKNLQGKSQKRTCSFFQKGKIQNNVLERFSKLFGIMLPVIGLCILSFAPMATVIEKDTGAVIAQGTGVSYIISGFSDATVNVTIIAVVLLALMLCLIVFSVFNLHIIALIVSVACTFAGLLAIYTDKKTTVINWGFGAIIVIMILFIVLQLIILQKEHAVDMRYFIRVAICLTVDTILVNILMGTYWTSVMYGKGFAFYLTTRMIKNLIQLPINIILSYYILSLLKRMKHSIIKS